MTIFDLLFIVAFVASVAALLTAAVYGLRGRRAQALRILWNLGMCAAAYFVSGMAVSLFAPQRVMHPGDPWCFDDWCLSVEKVTRTPLPASVSYDVSLRVFSTAGRVSQRAKDAWIYLIDDRGRRYSPDSDPSTVPLDVLLQPGESVATSRVFQVPAEVHELGLITGHGGPSYCGAMSVLIIGGSGCLFNKPAMIRLP
jgi:hypothetical protein